MSEAAEGHVLRSESPGAGPSRPRIDTSSSDEQEERELFLKKRKDYIELEQSVNSSNELLSSLASYLSTFQHDLSDVSGQISELQQRSSEIEAQLRGRKTIIPPLNALLSDITLPPSLVLTIRDTQPSANPDLWLQAVSQLDEKITAIQSRGKVKASHEMESIIDGLRISALTQLPPFLLSLIRPMKSASKGLSTNLAVLQTSLLLKYQPFYAFLARQSPKIAKQVERGYVNAARGYYETAFRRYTRALGVIKLRTVDKTELIGTTSATADTGSAGGYKVLYDRLKYANVDVEGQGGALLAYMADDKDLTVPVEAIFRSINLVLVDNASAEFTFLVRFFGRLTSSPQPVIPNRSDPPLLSPTPTHGGMSDSGRTTKTTTSRRGTQDISSAVNLKEAERIYHEIFDPALEYITTFFQSILITPPPSSLPLLTMIRLNDRLLELSEQRGAIPLEGYLQGQKMALWPLYRKEMDAHVDSLKKLADEAEGKGLSGFMGRGVRDQAVRAVASRYAAIFTSVTALSDEAAEGMIFQSMTRLRTELVRLVQTQAQKIKSPPDRHSFLSSIYDIIMHELVSGPGQTTHPKIQSELSFFRTREEESRRRLST